MSWDKSKYIEIYKRRINILRDIRADKTDKTAAAYWKYYKDHNIEFIETWMVTYDPRQVEPYMPFLLFPKQKEYIEWLDALSTDRENGLVEKARDGGYTWCSCAWATHRWLFFSGQAIGFGSRKEVLVDRIGVSDSIMEKVRIIVRNLPVEFRPKNYKERQHAGFMKIINPVNGSSIIGESGDNIGRGGRTSAYFKDEAQPLMSGILTPGGWETMGDMLIGTVVCGPDGKNRKVININDCGEHDIYRIGFTDGTHTECSTNHLWTVERSTRAKTKWKTVTAPTSEIIKDFKRKSPCGQIHYKYRIKKTDPVIFKQGAELPLHPYVVGVLLGDGSINTGCVSFSSADEEIVKNVKDRLPNGCAVTRDRDTYTYRIIDTERYNKSSRARKAVAAAQIYRKTAGNKSIPDIYKFASVPDRINLLQGLMDTDGSASGGTCTFHTCSKQLADDVRFIVQSLGGAAFLNTKPDSRGFRDMYCLHVVLPKKFNFFKLSRKNNQVNSRDREFGRTITSIEKKGREVVRCITVDSQDGLYLTDHCIVTHNSAHYERPEKIEAALSENTDMQVDISSVNGEGNIFHRRRFGGAVRVFIHDWRDDPRKNQAWYDKKKSKAIAEGLEHIFAQEIDRDYASSIEGVFIPAKWVKAAIDFECEPTGVRQAGLDPDDEGKDGKALVIRHGIKVLSCKFWHKGDTTETARDARFDALNAGCQLLVYDATGVGAGIKGELKSLDTESNEKIRHIGVHNGSKKLPGKYEDTDRLNSDLFENVRAMNMWKLRRRFEKTYERVNGIKQHHIDQCISIINDPELISEISRPKRLKTNAGKILVESKEAMRARGISSPNRLDALNLSFHSDTGFFEVLEW